MSFLRILCPAAACLLTGAFACAADEADAENLDNIIVTASRAPIRAPEVGSSVTVIDREEIEYRQARYVTDILRSVPGFALSHTGGVGTQTQVRVRGSEANHVLVLVDGMRANDPASGDEFRWEFLTTNDVERIEIVRGPQSALWGSDAVAAVVNVITRQGHGRQRIGGYVEGGSNETANAGFRASTGADRWSFGVSAEYLDTDGTNISRSGAERDGSDILGTSLNAAFDLTDNRSLTLGARYLDGTTEADPIDFFSTGLPTDGDLVNESKRRYLNATTTWRSGERVTHRATAQYFESDNRNLADGQWSASTASDRFRLGYQADIRFGDDLLALALEHERTEFRQRGLVSFGDPNQDQAIDVASVVADYQARLGKGVTWLASVRYDDNSDFEDALTGRLALSWQATDALRLSASAGTGQKAPTFIERFGFFPAQFAGNPTLEPESSMSYEVGAEHRFSDDALRLTVTLFRQDLEDEINGFAFDPATFLFTAENLAGKSRRQGVEWGARLHPRDNVELQATYTYTDASQPDNGAGTIELRRPKHSGSVAATLQLLDDRARVSFAADYGGTRFDRYFPPFPEPAAIVALPSYWLLDLAVSYDVSDRLSVFARATNLLDEDYEQVFGFRTASRSAYAGLRVDLGR